MGEHWAAMRAGLAVGEVRRKLEEEARRQQERRDSSLAQQRAALGDAIGLGPAPELGEDEEVEELPPSLSVMLGGMLSRLEDADAVAAGLLSRVVGGGGLGSSLPQAAVLNGPAGQVATLRDVVLLMSTRLQLLEDRLDALNEAI
jgi:hypothetical protein